MTFSPDHLSPSPDVLPSSRADAAVEHSEGAIPERPLTAVGSDNPSGDALFGQVPPAEARYSGLPPGVRVARAVGAAASAEQVATAIPDTSSTDRSGPAGSPETTTAPFQASDQESGTDEPDSEATDNSTSRDDWKERDARDKKPDWPADAGGHGGDNPPPPNEPPHGTAGADEPEREGGPGDLDRYPQEPSPRRPLPEQPERGPGLTREEARRFGLPEGALDDAIDTRQHAEEINKLLWGARAGEMDAETFGAEDKPTDDTDASDQSGTTTDETSGNAPDSEQSEEPPENEPPQTLSEHEEPEQTEPGSDTPQAAEPAERQITPESIAADDEAEEAPRRAMPDEDKSDPDLDNE